MKARLSIRTIALGSIAVVAGALAPILPGQALAQASTEAKAQVFFSNGGRIASMLADGSERQILTRSGKVVRPFGGALGDRAPKISPDGTKMLFFRATGDSGLESPFRVKGKTMVANTDGSDAREILRRKGRTTYREASWMPDGSIVATKQVRRGGRFSFRTRSSVVTMQLDGSGRRSIFRLKQDRLGSHQPIELASSPDGHSLLVTIQSLFEDERRLELVSMADGKRTLIARKSFSGSWSPDGQRIVFVSERGQNRKRCVPYIACQAAGDLFVANADGSAQTVLAAGKAATSPSWSPDGRQIAFSSTRMRPRQHVAAEVYSIKPDGSCLTWLTNGSPASITPSWGRTGSGEPGACGATERAPLVEGRPGDSDTFPARIPFRPRFWFGLDVDGALYSGDDEVLFLAATYADCSSFNPEDCGPGFAFSAIPTCLIAGSMASILRSLRKQGNGLMKRGVRVVQAKDGEASYTTVFSGGSIGTLLPLDLKNKSLTRARQLDLLDELRPVNASEASGDLPPMLVPRKAIKKARKVTRVFKRTDSIRVTAKRLKMKRKAVRANLSFKRNARWYGGIRPMNCPRGSSVGQLFRARDTEGGSSDRGSRTAVKKALRSIPLD